MVVVELAILTKRSRAEVLVVMKGEGELVTMWREKEVVGEEATAGYVRRQEAQKSYAQVAKMPKEER